MFLVFAEYKIMPHYAAEYRKWAEAVQQELPQLTIYEGSDQPCLFVEIWAEMTVEDYLHMKHARQAQNEGEWKRFNPLLKWINGGAEKLHIWRFEPVGKKAR